MKNVKRCKHLLKGVMLFTLVLAKSSFSYGNPYRDTNSDLETQNRPDINDTLNEESAEYSEGVTKISIWNDNSPSNFIAGIGFMVGNDIHIILPEDSNLEEAKVGQNITPAALGELSASMFHDNIKNSLYAQLGVQGQFLIDPDDKMNPLFGISLGGSGRFHFFNKKNRRFKVGGYVGGGLKGEIIGKSSKTSNSSVEGLLSAGAVIKLRPRGKEIFATHVGFIFKPSVETFGVSNEEETLVYSSQMAVGGEVVSALGQGSHLTIQGGFLKLLATNEKGQWIRVNAMVVVPKLRRNRHRKFGKIFIKGTAEVVKLAESDKENSVGQFIYPSQENGIHSQVFLFLGASL